MFSKDPNPFNEHRTMELEGKGMEHMKILDQEPLGKDPGGTRSPRKIGLKQNLVGRVIGP